MAAKQYAAKQPMGHWGSQRRNLKIPGDKWKWKHNDPKQMGHRKSSFKGEVSSTMSLLHERTKISNKQPNLTPKGTRKRTMTTKV